MKNTEFKPITKAVLPVAGLGTRFLPATKVTPKELVTVFDKPVLQKAVEEAQEGGITDFILVSSPNKPDITKHFRFNEALEATLRKAGKADLLHAVQKTNIAPEHIHVAMQNTPEGLGHAVYRARQFLEEEPFVLILPDVLMLADDGKINCTAQMINAYTEQGGGNVIAAYEVPEEEAHKYGILEAKGDGKVREITGMIEKPKQGTAPSNLSIVGRYILQYDIIKIIDGMIREDARGAGGEFQLTDAMVELLKAQPFHALNFEGQSYDCGSHIGALEASIAVALHDPASKNKTVELLSRQLNKINGNIDAAA